MKAVNNYPNTLLVGPVTIKRLSPINDNVEEQDLFTAVLSAQNIDLQNIIGNRLFWKLQELVSTANINNVLYLDYKILLDQYVIPFLVNIVTFKVMPIIQYKLRNKGVITTNDEHVNNAQYSEMKSLIEIYRGEATSYANLLKRFLRRNKSTYPELCCDENTIVCADLGEEYPTTFVI